MPLSADERRWHVRVVGTAAVKEYEQICSSRKRILPAQAPFYPLVRAVSQALVVVTQVKVIGAETLVEHGTASKGAIDKMNRSDLTHALLTVGTFQPFSDFRIVTCLTARTNAASEERVH